MSAKQTTKAAPEQSAEKTAPPPPRPREAVSVRVKTKSPGVKRQVCGVIFDNSWKHITLDNKGSAYKAIARDPAFVMEPLPSSAPSGDQLTASSQPPEQAKR